MPGMRADSLAVLHCQKNVLTGRSSRSPEFCGKVDDCVPFIWKVCPCLHVILCQIWPSHISEALIARHLRVSELQSSIRGSCKYTPSVTTFAPHTRRTHKQRCLRSTISTHANIMQLLGVHHECIWRTFATVTVLGPRLTSQLNHPPCGRFCPLLAKKRLCRLMYVVPHRSLQFFCSQTVAPGALDAFRASKN